MLFPANGSLLVKVDLEQKGTIEIGGQVFQKVPKFTVNNREKSPVVAVVVKGNRHLKKGQMIICHHNFFAAENRYSLGDDLFSIPYTDNIFAVIDDQGNAHPIGGNIICERIQKTIAGFEAPASYRKNYNDRVIVAQDGEGFKKGQQIFTLPMADYEILYNWGDQEKRIIKVKKGDIVAFIK